MFLNSSQEGERERGKNLLFSNLPSCVPQNVILDFVNSCLGHGKTVLGKALCNQITYIEMETPQDTLIYTSSDSVNGVTLAVGEVA